MSIPIGVRAERPWEGSYRLWTVTLRISMLFRDLKRMPTLPHPLTTQLRPVALARYMALSALAKVASSKSPG
jgi:hypothetical protein